MRGVSMQFTANRLAHGAMRPIAADHVIGAHRARCAPVDPAGIFERDGHRMIFGVLINGQAHYFPAVIRF